MLDYLLRSQAPLTDPEWQALDRTVVEVARRNLVARRFLAITGPVGAGVQSYAADRFMGAETAEISLFGAEEKGAIQVQSRHFVPLPILYHDFIINWRDLETSRRLGTALETTGAAIAASNVSAMEDRLIFNGYSEFQQEGFLNAEGRQMLPLGDWSVEGGAFEAVANAVQSLVQANFRGPYTVAASPQLYVQLNRIFDNTGVLEIDQIRRLVRGEVYTTPVLPENIAVVVAAGPENMDVLIAQDLMTAFLETTSMQHHFRVLEVLSLRVKRPGAIATLGQI